MFVFEALFILYTAILNVTAYFNQVEAIGKVRHANIATLRAYYWSYDEKLLVYDFIPNGNLSSAIHGMRLVDRIYIYIFSYTSRAHEKIENCAKFDHEHTFC